MRPGAVEPIAPKVGVESELSGPPRFVWLNRLNASKRICRVRRSKAEKLLKTDASTFSAPGARTRLRPESPYAPIAGCANALGSNHWFTFFFKPDGNHLPTTSARWPKPWLRN